MKKYLLIVVAALLALGLIVPSAYAEGQWEGNTNFFLGGKSLDKEDWEPVEQQGEFGVMVDFGKQGWPVHIAIDFMASGTKEIVGGDTVKGSTAELDIGFRKIFDIGGMHPFVGGGIGSMSGSTEFPGVGECKGSGGGGWADAGIFWTLGKSFNLGFDARYSSATVELECPGGVTVDKKVGGGHFGLLLGYHWK